MIKYLDFSVSERTFIVLKTPHKYPTHRTNKNFVSWRHAWCVQLVFINRLIVGEITFRTYGATIGKDYRFSRTSVP